MEHQVPTLIILDDIEDVLPNEFMALHRGAVGELYAPLRSEGIGEVPFGGLGASLADEEDVVF